MKELACHVLVCRVLGCCVVVCCVLVRCVVVLVCTFLQSEQRYAPNFPFRFLFVVESGSMVVGASSGLPSKAHLAALSNELLLNHQATLATNHTFLASNLMT